MKRILPIFLILALCVLSAQNQNFGWTYEAGYEVAASTSAKVTLQLPSDATNWARPKWVSISCPAAVCAMQFIRGGTVATTTAGTPTTQRTSTPDPGQVLWFTASNSTGGTASPVKRLPQGLVTLGMDDFELRAGERVSILVTGASDTRTINVMWEEYPH